MDPHGFRVPAPVMLASAVVLCGVLAWPGGSRAGGVSYTGTFNLDNQVQIETFTLSAASDVTLRTWSFLGGTNYAGQVIPAGGFDTLLTLFGPGGGYLDFNDDINYNNGNWDALLSEHALAPGTYTVALTQYDNYANAYLEYLSTGSTSGTLADGFSEAANPNFTLSFPNTPAGASGYFWDASGIQRTGNWALDIVSSAAVPEPPSVLLCAIGAVARLGWMRKRPRKCVAA